MPPAFARCSIPLKQPKRKTSRWWQGFAGVTRERGASFTNAFTMGPLAIFARFTRRITPARSNRCRPWPNAHPDAAIWSGNCATGIISPGFRAMAMSSRPAIAWIKRRGASRISHRSRRWQSEDAKLLTIRATSSITCSSFMSFKTKCASSLDSDKSGTVTGTIPIT